MKKTQMHNTGVHRRIPVLAIPALVAVLALLGIVSPIALAAPKGIFARFALCPTNISGNALCEYAEVTSGEFAIGSVKVPIDKTIVFQGGTLSTGVNLNEYFELPAAIPSESVSPTKLDVPGGLRTILGCPHHNRGDRDHDRFFAHYACAGYGQRANDVTALVEPVASPSNPSILSLGALLSEESTALVFPERIHLENPLLGEACYLGSETDPIMLRLTDGKTNPPSPNQPITGKLGELGTEEESGYETLVVTDDTLVDNAFSIPPAEGCGASHSSIIDPMIDRTLGLESPAGRNTAILTGTHWLTQGAAVTASETFPTKEENTPPHHHHHHRHHWWWPTH
jgi:hypothetical protein